MRGTEFFCVGDLVRLKRGYAGYRGVALYGNRFAEGGGLSGWLGDFKPGTMAIVLEWRPAVMTSKYTRTQGTAKVMISSTGQVGWFGTDYLEVVQ